MSKGCAKQFFLGLALILILYTLIPVLWYLDWKKKRRDDDLR